MAADITPRNWHRDNYLVSSDPALIQVDAVNAALDSSMMWWARSLPRDQMQKALQNSFCLGLYALPDSAAQSYQAGITDGNSGPGSNDEASHEPVAAGQTMPQPLIAETKSKPAERVTDKHDAHFNSSGVANSNWASTGGNRQCDVRLSLGRLCTARIPGPWLGTLVEYVMPAKPLE
jgi:hypothetical protein